MVFRYNIPLSLSSITFEQDYPTKASDNKKEMVSSMKQLKQLTSNNKKFLTSLGFTVIKRTE